MRPRVQAMLENRVVEMVNAERWKVGCGSLTVVSTLTTAARGHSVDMATRDFFSHASPEGFAVDTRVSIAGYQWSYVGENIAWGQPDARSVMTAWMNSRGHRANVLDPAFVHIGVGVTDDRQGNLVWTQNFGSPAELER